MRARAASTARAQDGAPARRRCPLRPSQPRFPSPGSPSLLLLFRGLAVLASICVVASAALAPVDADLPGGAARYYSTWRERKEEVV